MSRVSKTAAAVHTRWKKRRRMGNRRIKREIRRSKRKRRRKRKGLSLVIFLIVAADFNDLSDVRVGTQV